MKDSPLYYQLIRNLPVWMFDLTASISILLFVAVIIEKIEHAIVCQVNSQLFLALFDSLTLRECFLQALPTNRVLACERTTKTCNYRLLFYL